ncbi:MAG TPA: hypothetical protein VFW40_13015 [Capsulimonadaceae bacterium]|nr:hypothetical protein [Capsulimonadaceae bacterium]
MNAVQIISEIQVFSNSAEGQFIFSLIEGNLNTTATQAVDSDLAAYLQANPNVTQEETVATLQGREFHNLRVKLGWLGFLVDGLANDVQVVAKVQAFIRSRIAAAEAAGTVVVNAQTGALSLAPKAG